MFRTPPDDSATRPDVRRRPLDNPRVLIAAALLLLALLAGLFWLSGTTTEIALPRPDRRACCTRCSACDLALVFALGFVLARNLLKLWVEQRRPRRSRGFAPSWWRRCSR